MLNIRRKIIPSGVDAAFHEQGLMMNKERFGGLLFLLPGLYGLIFSLEYPMGKWDEPGPGVFPLFLSITLFVAGILWLVFGKREAEGIQEDRGEMVMKLSKPLQIVGLTAGLIFFLERLGYLLGTSLYLFALLFWVSRFSVWIAIGLAAFLAVGSWYFFGKLLSVQLPQGVLPF
jgi:putative tricarboxylic transport membrane protein